MMNLNAYSISLKTFLSVVILITFQAYTYASCPDADYNFYSDSKIVSESEVNNESVRDTVPEPRKVMARSLMVPGWGQITNQQTWKVPLVYALIGGVVYSIFYFDEQYQGYRAAYYNSFPNNTDQRFGPTPDFINPEFSQSGLREQRNSLRNNRDLAIVLSFVAYGLNAVDAYVFAHFRDFDVSDDLSANIRPDFDFSPVGDIYPTVTLHFKF